MSSSSFTFPSPVGGIPLALDLAPSILFVILYGLLVAVAFRRLWLPKSRTIAVIATFVFAVERVVVFTLRAVECKDLQLRDSSGLTRYMQSTLGVGYINISADLVMLMRSLLAAAASSRGSNEQREQSVPPADIDASQSTVILKGPEGEKISATVQVQSTSEIDDRAKETWWNQRISIVVLVLCWVSLALGIVQGALYPDAEKSVSKARLVQQMRYASSGFICAAQASLQVFSVYCTFRVRNIHRYHTYLITALVTLMNTITIYRLVVMVNQTTAIDSLAPGSLNRPGSKATFYVFHVAPEWITAAVLIGINVKERFETGFWGQLRPSKNKSPTNA